MLKPIVFVALFGAALGFAVGGPAEISFGEATTSRPPYDDVTYFDCTGQHGAYHSHPWDCTRFIQCHNGRSADMPCAHCNETARCPDGYLNWDPRINVCNWPDVVGCIPGQGTTVAPTPLPTTVAPTPPPTTVAPTQPPTTVAPTPPPTTVAPTQPPTTVAPTQPPTTVAPTQPPTTVAPTQPPTTVAPTQPPTTLPPIGEDCDPINCDVDGDCHGYLFCERIISPAGPRNDTGIVVRGDCGDLYYDPDLSANSPIAICSLWRDLKESVRDSYREDALCDPYCRLIPQGTCTGSYVYRDPAGVETPRNCPAGTILDVAVRRCVDSCKASPSANCTAC